jgi:hypothetical protein
LVYADDANSFQENIKTTKRNTEAVTAMSNDAGLEANIQKTEYMSCLVFIIQDKSKT